MGTEYGSNANALKSRTYLIQKYEKKKKDSIALENKSQFYKDIDKETAFNVDWSHWQYKSLFGGTDILIS